jgi:hypothetical protein
MHRPRSLFDTVFTSLPWRKAYHFAGGIGLLLAFTFLPPLALYAVCITYLIGFLVFGKRISFAVLGALLLFAITRSRFAVLGSVLVFTLGDGLAAVIGARFGRSRLPWNGEKTVLGSLTYLLAASAGMAFFVWLAAPIHPGEQLIVILVPSIVGAAIESLPLTTIRDRKPDDILLSILGVGLVLFALQIVFAIPTTPRGLIAD